MWIRSQNKEVLLDIQGKGIYIKEYGGEDFTIIESVTNLRLGTYKTKERAIEVLDKIYEEIINTLPSDPNSFLVVYQMPRE